MKPTRRQRRFMAAMMPDGSVSTGTDTGRECHRAGWVEVHPFKDRYQLTENGRTLMKQFPEGNWPMPSDERFKRRTTTWRR